MVVIGVGAEVVGAGVDQADRLLGAIGGEDRVGDDLAIEVDVGFGDGGDVFEFHGTDLVRGGRGRVKEK